MIRLSQITILTAALALPSLALSAPAAGQVAAAKTPAKRGTLVRLYAGRHGAWVLQCFRNPQKRIVCNLGQARTYKVSAAERKKIKGTPQLILLVQGSTLAETVLFISPSRYAKESRLIARVDTKYGFGIETPSNNAIAALSPKASKPIVTNFMVGNELRVKFLPGVGDVQLLRFNLAGFTSGIKTMRALLKKHGKNEPKPKPAPKPATPKPAPAKK
ncbi:MAG: hypothetical protein ACTSUD_02965 [Alphaproteobacteria bacterium]